MSDGGCVMPVAVDVGRGSGTERKGKHRDIKVKQGQKGEEANREK